MNGRMDSDGFVGAGPVPDDVDAAWSDAARSAPYLAMSSDDYGRVAQDDRMLFVAAAGGGRAILPFIRRREAHKFTIGERRLGSMDVATLDLATPWLVEGRDVGAVAQALSGALRDSGADVLRLGEIPLDCTLARALPQLSWPMRAVALGRKPSLRWVIDLPESFEAYMAGLSSSTRQSQRRKMRKLEKDFDVDLEIVTTAGQIPRFLAEGEKISRLTYQWNVGQRLTDDAATLAHFTRLAGEGRLRCYLMSLDGVPRAFLRGALDGVTYDYATPGFDPEFGRTSIGTVLLLRAIEDLIGNTDCKVFDFGTGGDETGYKSSFGNRSIPANSFVVIRMDRPRGALLRAGQGSLNGIKNALDRVMRNEDLRRALRRRIRRYGE